MPASALLIDGVSRPLTYQGGLSQPVPLPGGGGLAVRVPQDAPEGAAWRVEALAEPEVDPGAVLAALTRLPPGTIDALFGANDPEPYRSWRATWEADLPLPERLGAVLLALARRTDELRLGEAR